MSNLLQQGADMLARARRDHASNTVTVRHNGDSQDVLATPGRTNFRTTDRSGQSVLIPTRDYLVHINDWPWDSKPDRGTEFRETDSDGTVYVYRASTPNSEELWRWSTPYKKQMRIHTTLVGEE